MVDSALPGLLPTLAAPTRTEAMAYERTLRRECGMLFRHWAARAVWENVLDDADATQVNLELLRLCTAGFKLPKDGSGLRYSELGTAEEEGREFWHRLTHGIGVEGAGLLGTVERSLPGWRRDVAAAVERALAQSLTVLEAEAKAWTQQIPPAQNLISEGT